MNRWWASGLLAAAALGAAPLWVAATPGPACASASPAAALVVDTGDEVLSYCVALPTDEVTGIDLIALAGDQHGVSYDLGYGGQAVCMLAGVGPTGDDCFAEYPEFWGYWRGDSSGGWSWSSSGAGSTSVGDGDVEGWSWGAGDGPASHQPPPATTFESVCPSGTRGAGGDVAGDGDETGSRRDRRAGNERAATQAPAGTPGPPDESAAGASHRRAPRGPTERVDRSGQEKSLAVELAPPPLPPRPAPGPSAGAIGAVAATAALGATGVMFTRRRRRQNS